MESAGIAKDICKISVSRIEGRLRADALRFASLETFEGQAFYLTFSVSDLSHVRTTLAKRIDQLKGVLSALHNH